MRIINNLNSTVMVNTILFEKHINEWAEINAVNVCETGYMHITGFYYIDIKTPELCWKNLKSLERFCKLMDVEIYNIAIDRIDEDSNIYTIWIA